MTTGGAQRMGEGEEGGREEKPGSGRRWNERNAK